MNPPDDRGAFRSADPVPPDPTGSSGDVAGPARLAEAVQRRRRRRWQEQLSTEEVSVDSVLLGALGRALDARGRTEPAAPADVTLRLVAGSPVRGSVVRLGADAVELRSGATSSIVPIAAIEAVEVDGTLRGDPSDRSDAELAEVIESAAPPGSDVSVTTTSGSVVTGRLAGIGTAVVVRTGPEGRVAVVALEHLVALTCTPEG